MQVDASDSTRRYLATSLLMGSCKEAQIHGDVRLADNVELIMVNPQLRGTYTPHSKAPIVDMLGKLATHCNASSWIWMDMGHASPPSSSCAIAPRTKSTPYRVPAPLPHPADSLGEEENDELQRALKASKELLEEQRHLQAQSELDLARAMQLSVEDDRLAKAVQASLAAAVAPVAVVDGPTDHIESPSEPLISTNVAEASTEMEHVLKVSHGDDLRRLRICLPRASGPGDISAAIETAVCKSFGLPSIGHCLKYEDEDGDKCTLVTATVADYMSLCQGAALKKVWICDMHQQTIAHYPELAPACTAGAVPFAEAGACSPDSEEQAPSTEEASPSIEEAAVSEKVAVDSAEDSVTLANMLAPEVSLPSADANVLAAEEVSSLTKASAGCADVSSVTLSSDVEVLATAEAISFLTEAPAISSSSEVLQFSMDTPPASPRVCVEALQSATRIEDEYEDDCVAWTFVAECAE